MAFTKTGAPEKGVRIGEAVPIDAVDCPETKEAVEEPEEGKEEAEEDAAEPK